MKKEYWIILILLVLVIAGSVFAKPIKKMLTRGYQNNNAGNIRLQKDSKGNLILWKGEIKGKDKAFKTFKSMEYGYRALFVNLQSYFKNGLNTIEKIITTYAPSNENNTKAYIKTVSEYTKIPSFQQLSIADTERIKNIVAAISYVENGIKPDLMQIENGYKLLQS